MHNGTASSKLATNFRFCINFTKSKKVSLICYEFMRKDLIKNKKMLGIYNNASAFPILIYLCSRNCD